MTLRNPARTKHRDPPASVLVVEDDDDIRDVVVRALAEDGFEVREASSGPAALRSVEGERVPDVAVVDLRLPGGVDGQEICRRLHERGRRVLLCSSSDSLAAAARASRADDWIAKPFDLDELRRRVRRLAAAS